MKARRIVYWIATGLLALLVLFSASMYFLNHEEVAETFKKLGHPTYIIYPLAILKVLGLGVILSNRGGSLKEWAHAGFFFNFVLAFFAHFMLGDGEHLPALVGIILLMTSYFLGKKVRF